MNKEMNKMLSTIKSGSNINRLTTFSFNVIREEKKISKKNYLNDYINKIIC